MRVRLVSDASNMLAFTGVPVTLAHQGTGAIADLGGHTDRRNLGSFAVICSDLCKRLNESCDQRACHLSDENCEPKRG
jgi:hypothetical protein